MKKFDRLQTKKLGLRHETIRALARVELAGVMGGADSADPCVVAKRLAVTSTGPGCG